MWEGEGGGGGHWARHMEGFCWVGKGPIIKKRYSEEVKKGTT